MHAREGEEGGIFLGRHSVFVSVRASIPSGWCVCVRLCACARARVDASSPLAGRPNRQKDWPTSIPSHPISDGRLRAHTQKCDANTRHRPTDSHSRRAHTHTQFWLRARTFQNKVHHCGRGGRGGGDGDDGARTKSVRKNCKFSHFESVGARA